MTHLFLRFPVRLGLLALGVGACFLAAAPGAAEVIERVLVKVNGEIFTTSDLEARQIGSLRQQRAAQPMSDAELTKQIEAVTPQLLVDAVDEILLLQRGKELGYKMNDEQFKGVLDRLKSENKIETEAQFQAALKGEGLTLTELRRNVEKRYVVDRVENAEVFSRIGVNEDEARRYYEEHKREFTTVPTVTVRELFVRVGGDSSKGLNVGLDDEARQKMEAIRARLAAGESFEKLAGELSDAPSKANGGLVGPINRSELAPVIAKALETMKIGDLSPVVRVATGYEVVKLDSATEQTVLPFGEARPQIANKVFAAKQQVEFEAYLKKLRASAIIEWKVPELKKRYDEAIARGGPANPGIDQTSSRAGVVNIEASFHATALESALRPVGAYRRTDGGAGRCLRPAFREASQQTAGEAW
jgi:parvulin-like peptidyl-prolyl isomerase